MKDSQKSSLSRQRRDLDLAGNSTTTTIPFDLIFEILSLLPAKSLLRFQSVSKIWFSTIRSKSFVATFLTRSKTGPRLLFTFDREYSREKFLFSAPEYDNNYDDKSSSVIARYHMTISRYDVLCGSVNGFVCFRSVVSSKPDAITITVYNPTTRQIIKLPDLKFDESYMNAVLGYDPAEDQYKVLCVIMLDRKSQQQEHFVCTVSSSPEQEWRKMENTTGDKYYNICGETCIDGALYYGVGQLKIARFDVRSERIDFIKTPKESPIWIACNSGLMNYNGKLGCLDYSCTNNNLMTLWVLEDVEKQEWSSMTYDLPNQWAAATLGVGTVTKGVIRFGASMEFRLPFRVCYYDFNKKNTREVEIRGMEEDGVLTRISGHGLGKLTGNPGHIENIRFL